MIDEVGGIQVSGTHGKREEREGQVELIKGKRGREYISGGCGCGKSCQDPSGSLSQLLRRIHVALPAVILSCTEPRSRP